MEPLWFVAVIGGPVILAIALVVGIRQWRRRPVSDRVRDTVTRANYRAAEDREKRIEREESADAGR